MFDLNETTALLRRTPAALDALLRGLPDMWTSRNEGEGTWSVRDVIAHLIFGERTDWMPRTRLILDYGDTRPFDPFDRVASVQEKGPIGDLLDEFSRLRAVSLDHLRALRLTEADLARRGLHPALGTVTLAQLLAAWAAHDLTHLHQISRVMAHQIRDDAGPWTAFMGVMQCDGHSA